MSEADLLAALVSSGPLAAALGAAVVVLWRALKHERERNTELHREVIQFLREIRIEERASRDEL